MRQSDERVSGPHAPTHLAVGQRLPLTLGGLALGGEAIGRVDGFVIFVENGVPGDEALVEITEVKKSYARARVEQLHQASPSRVSPPCPIYAECGGCQLQHLTYDAQLEAKRRFVQDALAHIAGLRDVLVRPTRPTAAWNYRNKMQLVAGRGGRLGLYRRHSHRIVPMDECLIAHPLTNKILAAATDILQRMSWPPYDERSGKGLLRHVLARVGGVPGREEALIVVIATASHVPNVQRFARKLMEAVPQVVGVMLNVNAERTNVILGRRTFAVAGRDHVVQTVNGVNFRIGPASFFQVNTVGLEVIAELVADALQPSPSDRLVDAYCGVGALSLLLARRVREVVGLEEVLQAVDNARHNALLNGISNVSFQCGTVEALLGNVAAPDAIILDPPRKGCAASVLETIARQEVPRIVYVSCNPATLARDAAILEPQGYAMRYVQPLDMFPQTSHVECVALIERRSAVPRSEAQGTEKSVH